MQKPFRFAVQTGPFADPTALADHARMVEDLGYDELWSADHIGAVDPFLPLLAAAHATTTLRVGPLVLNNEFHNPVLLARSAATLDALTGGRLILGLGTGFMQSEHDAADIELRPPARRVTRLIETVEVVRALLDTGAAHFDGEEVTVHLNDLGVRPAQEHVPILIGGSGRRMMALAARRADVVQLTGMSHDAATGALAPTEFGDDAVGARIAWLEEASDGRLPEMDVSALVQRTHIAADTAEVRAGLMERLGCPSELIDTAPFVHVGNEDQIIEKLQRLRTDHGINHHVVRDPEDFAPIVAALAGT